MPVDTTLAVVPTGTDANKTVATVSVDGEGNTVTKAGTTYYYKVKAISKVRSTANSAFSTVVSIKAK